MIVGFLEDSYLTAKEVIDAAGKKGSEMLEVQKIKVSIARLNAQLTKDFETLGRLSYDSAKNGVNIDDVHAALVLTIAEKYQEIDRLQAKLAKTKGLKFCEKCGACNPPESDFCNKCGAGLQGKGEQPAASCGEPKAESDEQ